MENCFAMGIASLWPTSALVLEDGGLMATHDVHFLPGRSDAATTAGQARRRGITELGVLPMLIGFASAVWMRGLIGGSGVADDPGAGLALGGLLLLLSTVATPRLTGSARGVLGGLAGAGLLCAPVLATRSGPLHDHDGFWSWALVVSFVATSEEIFLRGALYHVLERSAGTNVAVAVPAAAFAALHVPLYGWHVVPLDLVVGAILGELRRSTGTLDAPVLAHVGADLAAWFLR